MQNVNEEWFRSALAARGKSARAMARYMQTDPSSISLMLRGHRPFSLADCEQAARFLGVPVTDVLEAAGLPVHRLDAEAMRVPVTGLLQPDGMITDPPDQHHVIPPFMLSRGSYAIYAPPTPTPGLSGFMIIAGPPADGVLPETVGRHAVVIERSGTRRFGMLEHDPFVRGGYRLRSHDGQTRRVDVSQTSPTHLILP